MGGPAITHLLFHWPSHLKTPYLPRLPPYKSLNWNVGNFNAREISALFTINTSEFLQNLSTLIFQLIHQQIEKSI
jgi:hypothetical protein